MKIELTAISAVAVAVSIFNTALLTADKSAGDGLRWTLVVLAVEAVCALQALWPLWLSFKVEREQRDALQRLDSARHLRDVLALPEGFAAYLQFASLDFSGERPLFWQSAGELTDAIARKLGPSSGSRSSGNARGSLDRKSTRLNSSHT